VSHEASVDIASAPHDLRLVEGAASGRTQRVPVLLIGTFLSQRPGTRSAGEDLAAQLRTRGWQVLTTSHRRTRAARVGDILATIWRCRQQFQVAHIDVYSGLAFVWAEGASILLGRLGIPHIVSLHGGDLPAFAARHPWRVTRLLGRATAVTAPSRYLAEKLQPLASTEIRVIPNPLQLANYAFRHRTAPLPNLVWLRAFHAIYNPGLALRVLALLRQDIPSATLTMVGPDKRDGSCEQAHNLAQQLGLAERVNFAGPVPKSAVNEWLDRGDIFLNTANVDNTPVTVLEAMACGLCVVSTDVGGLPYLIRDGDTGILVPPDNASAMSRAVCQLLTRPRVAAQLSQAGRAEAEMRDWAAVWPQWEALLAEVARRSP
jgi:glycosyltransferase involved in cell wall biosynthesis